MNPLTNNIAGWFILLCLATVIGGFWSCSETKVSPLPDSSKKPVSIFSLLPGEQTGIQFTNALEEGLNTNILMYEYFYNGSGVAAADFNDDNLIDLYFTSNMGSNALYLNRGDLRFEETARESGVTGRPGPWKTGVSAADVNGDGRMDLYVSYSGSLPPEKRKNELFINIGNDQEGKPQFEERAEQFGLASDAFSTQSYFFDYDRDGDLDMLLLNHNPKNLPILNEVMTRKLLEVDDPLRGVRLFRQDNGYFNDVTNEAGISSSELTYGLGIGLGDFNNDNWPDFYISNDYSVPDYLYINRGNGKFENTSNDALGHMSHFSMGNDIGDINHDGLPDIITLDMLPEDNRRQKLLLTPDEYSKFDLNVRSGFHHQYMRNMLQLNNGNGTFSEIGQWAGISNTDWSWSALLADYDNDGYKDLYVTNGYFRDYTNLDFINYMNDFVQTKGRLKREDVIVMINHMPSTEVSNYLYQGQSDFSFKDVTSDWAVKMPSKSNGAVYADLDNDGDLEIVVNNINQPAFIFKNDAVEKNGNHYLQVQLKGEKTNTFGIGAKVLVYKDKTVHLLEQYLSRGYQSSVSPVLHLGLGQDTPVDSLVVTWPSGKKEKLENVDIDTRIVLEERLALQGQSPKRVHEQTLFQPIVSPVNFQHGSYAIRDFDRQSLLMAELSESGPCMTISDINHDGLDDLFIGGAKDQPGKIFIQSPSGAFSEKGQPAFEEDAERVDVDAQFFDANDDGHPDLYVVSGGYHDFNAEDSRLQDRIYLNDGTGKFTLSREALPPSFVSGSCLAVSDINGDGYLDVFVGGRVIPGRYPETPESMILINDGTGKFELKTQAWSSELSGIGMVTDAEWIDIDRDNVMDLIVVGEWMPVHIFLNKDGRLIDETSRFLDKSYNGFWNTISVADVNMDGLADFTVGNLGKNVQFKASEDEPCEMYYGDFDNNGSVDPILCYYINGLSYPYVTRDELRRQLAQQASKYTSFQSYADEEIADIIGSEGLAQSKKLRVSYLETSFFMSRPDGSYERRVLPAEAQYAPVYVISTMDYDSDGKLDMLLCGNNSSLKLRLGKADANYGVLLTGDGNGNFSYVRQTKSGLALKGDVRSVVKINDDVLFGIYQNGVQAYRNGLAKQQ